MNWFKGCFLLFTIELCNLYVEAQRGGPCRTPNGQSAICRSIYDCNSLLGVIRTRDTVQLRFIRESQCGHDSDPLVCCGTATNYMTTATQASVSGRRLVGSGGNRNTQFTRNQLIPTRSSCGFQETDKIFDGQETALDEFPWMVLLQYMNSAGNRRWSCAGTLISNRYVLTAAHCVTGDILQKVGRLVTARLGEYNTETEIDCKSSRNCNQRPLDMAIDSIIAHPGYDNNNANRYDDIALIRLSRAVTYTNYIRPICLPEPNESANLGEPVTVAGWGKTERLNRSPIKLKVEIPIAEREQCTQKFSSESIILRDSQICAGGQRGRDSCTGDSGGPLMKTSKSDPSQWYQEGIVSFGAQCGSEGWPGIYTKVADYLPWIHNTVKN
ncbi:hypothetical protein JTB14_007353 [Gonioctena quinquepunctata]|nr:hypothetical protein JTB14_007353 [Gonioctena quinquepunctata]